MHEEVAHSVVKITNHTLRQDFNRPEASWHSSTMAGTGWIVEYRGKTFVVTNAHVVADTRELKLERFGDKKKSYTGTIQPKKVGRNVDLAIVEVADPNFFTGIKKPFILAESNAQIRSPVTVFGFPTYGNDIAQTDGWVTRYVVANYAWPSLSEHLEGYTDAPINPGNSGGPVCLKDNPQKVVGVIHQVLVASVTPSGGVLVPQAVNGFIPLVLLRSYLDSYLDTPEYLGEPSLAISYALLPNSNSRQIAHVGPEVTTGVIIDKVNPQSPEAEFIKVDDVIHSYDGHPIFSDGTIAIDDHGLTVPCQGFFARKKIGDHLKVGLQREGVYQEVNFVLSHNEYAYYPVKRREFNGVASFYIDSGVVLRPLDDSLVRLSAETKDPGCSDSICSLIEQLIEQDTSEVEPVFLDSILTSDESSGYGGRRLPCTQIKRINGEEVKNFEGAIKIIENIPTGSPMIIELTHSRKIRLIRMTHERSADLLKQNRITEGGSPEVLELVQGLRQPLMEPEEPQPVIVPESPAQPVPVQQQLMTQQYKLIHLPHRAVFPPVVYYPPPGFRYFK